MDSPPGSHAFLRAAGANGGPGPWEIEPGAEVVLLDPKAPWEKPCGGGITAGTIREVPELAELRPVRPGFRPTLAPTRVACPGIGPHGDAVALFRFVPGMDGYVCDFPRADGSYPRRAEAALEPRFRLSRRIQAALHAGGVSVWLVAAGDRSPLLTSLIAAVSKAGNEHRLRGTLPGRWRAAYRSVRAGQQPAHSATVPEGPAWRPPSAYEVNHRPPVRSPAIRS